MGEETSPRESGEHHTYPAAPRVPQYTLGQSLRTSAVVRMIFVAGVALALLAPISLVKVLIGERKERRDAAVLEITAKWANPQTIAGPILTVPVRYDTAGGSGARTVHVHVLPDSLSFRSEVEPEVRYRGIFKVVLYVAKISLEADFGSAFERDQAGAGGEPEWDKAFVSVCVSDPKGIRSASAAAGGKPVPGPEGALLTGDLGQSGFSIPLPQTPGVAPGRVAVELKLAGSEEIRFAPLGKSNRGELDCRWSAPSFTGDFLPESREISDEAFRATWEVPHWNRALPPRWAGSQPKLTDQTLGVKLLQVVDEYRKTSRAVKYAVMFVALTFLAFFVVDVLRRSPFHPVHYVLVGMALVLFYVLLLSISEYLAFNTSYVISSAATVLLVSLYTRGISRRWSVAGAIGGVLAILYAFLLVLLQLEDYALLLGSLLLFGSLALVMYLTRRIDWFDLGKQNGGDAKK